MDRRAFLVTLGVGSSAAALASLAGRFPAAVAPARAQGVPFKKFKVAKDIGVRGKESVVVVVKKQEPIIEKQLSAKIDCEKAPGVFKTGCEKAREVAASLAQQIEDSDLLRGHVKIEAQCPPDVPEQGNVVGTIDDAEPFIFREVHTSPCKDGDRHEFDHVDTDPLAPQTAILWLGRGTSTGQVTLLLDDTVKVATETDGKSPGMVAQDLAALLVQAGRRARARRRKVLVLDAFSIAALVTDPALRFRFGLRQG